MSTQNVKPTGDATPNSTPSSTPKLPRGLGVVGIVGLVVSAAAPLGVVAGTMPVVFLVTQSYALPLHVIIVTVLLLLFSVGYTRMSRQVRNPGAFYSYIQSGLGRIAGVGAATLAVISYILILVACAAYLGVFTTGLIQHYLHTDTKWWIWSFVAIAITAVLGYREIDVSAKALGFFVAAEVVVIMVFNLAVLFKGGAGGLTLAPVLPSALGSGSLSIGLMFAIFGFIGFEATAVFRSEARDPDVTVPRATFVAVIVIGAFYAVSLWLIVNAAGVGNVVQGASADPAGFVPGLAAKYVGSVWGDVVQVMLVTSTFAAMLSFHNVIARYQFTLSKRGLLPRKLGVVHPRHNAPSNSSLALTVVTVVLTVGAVVSGLDPVVKIYAWFSGAAALGIIFLMALTSAAVIVYFRRNRGVDGNLWGTLIAPAVAFAGLATIVYLVVANLDILIGDHTSAVVVGIAMLVSFLAGCALALFLKVSRPDRYAMLEFE